MDKLNKNFQKAIKGQGVTTIPDHFSMNRRLLTGDDLEFCEVIEATLSRNNVFSCVRVHNKFEFLILQIKSYNVFSFASIRIATND